MRSQSRSQGIGKQLLDQAKAVRPSLTLSVYRKNSRAVSFYQREGFSVLSQETDSGTGEMELVMAWGRAQKGC